MSIMDFFKPAAPTNNQQQQQTQQTQQQPNQQQQAPSTPNPANANPTGTNMPVNPLDAYKEMFNNANKSAEVAPSFALPADKLNEVAGKLDFTQGVPSELMQKAMTGDAQAMLDIINHTGRQAYIHSLSHTTQLTDKFVGSRAEFDAKHLGSKVKSELTQTELSSSANFDHPVLKAELIRVANQFQQANPDAAPAEIAKAAKQYLGDLYAAMNPDAGKPNQSEQKAGETNWDEYFKR